MERDKEFLLSVFTIAAGLRVRGKLSDRSVKWVLALAFSTLR